MLSKNTFSLTHALIRHTCFSHSIRLFTKVLFIRQFVNMLPNVDVVYEILSLFKNRTFPTNNVDKCKAAYIPQKEQKYLWLPFQLAYCGFGNFRENFIFKRHISDLKNS